MAEAPTKYPRTGLLMYGAGGLFLVAALSQARAQIFSRAEILQMAGKTRHLNLSRTDYAHRGSILTSDGKALAQDLDAYELSLQYAKVPKTDAFYMALSAASGIPASEFAQLSTGKNATWPQAISAEQKIAIDKVKSDWKADGVSVRRIDRRQYPLGEAAAAFVGAYRCEKDDHGKTKLDNSLGMEAFFGKNLSGKDGNTVGMVDRSGTFLPMTMQVDPKSDGETLLTTVDSDLQVVASDAIREAVDENKATNGVAIVMNPNTGDILAMSCWPSFDPNRQANDASAPIGRSQINVAGQLQFEPGSMFKILTLAKGLDTHIVSPTETFLCQGEMQVGDRIIHCDSHHGNRAHGLLTPEMAIAKSCNLDAATWSMRIGRDNMIDYVEKLGLLEKTGIGIPKEAKGKFNTSKKAYGKRIQTATLGFGQSITATPIELISAFSAIANDGIRMKPRLVQKMGERPVPVQSAGRVLGTQTCETVMHFMEAVVESDEGTAKSLRIPGYRLAGKTGTAQKINSKEKGYVSNFVGFVPAQKPKAVILVMVNNPTAGEYYGASVAGPVFVKVAKSVIERLQIPKSAPVASNQPALVPIIGNPGPKPQQVIVAPPLHAKPKSAGVAAMGIAPKKGPTLEVKVAE